MFVRFCFGGVFLVLSVLQFLSFSLFPAVCSSCGMPIPPLKRLFFWHAWALMYLCTHAHTHDYSGHTPPSYLPGSNGKDGYIQ